MPGRDPGLSPAPESPAAPVAESGTPPLPPTPATTAAPPIPRHRTGLLPALRARLAALSLWLRAGDYSVGTLHYSRAGLAMVFFWLLWGDFCFQMMETVRPRLMQLYLLSKDGLGVSNTTATVLLTIIPNVFGLFVGPAVSFRSDRHRGPFGRRIPYIVWTMPILVVGLIGLGFSEQIHLYLAGSRLPALLHLSPLNLTIIIIAFFTLVIAFANEFVDSVYWYLFADVVPEAFLGRFMGMFRAVSIGAGMFFSYFLWPHAKTHMHWIFLGVALLYLIGFSLMCWRVKEGQYPPPEPLGDHPSVLREIKTYLVECFSHPIYIALFAFSMLTAMAQTAYLGMAVFTNEGLGITLLQMGQVETVTRFISVGLAVPTGWLADRIGPLRLRAWLQLLNAPLLFAMFFFLHDFPSYVLFQGLLLVYNSMTDACDVPVLMVVFPKDRYGQFASCNGMMRSLARLAVAPLAALFMDYMTRNGTLVDAYRWMYIWGGSLQILNCAVLLWVYLLWRRHGGRHGRYLAPGAEPPWQICRGCGYDLRVSQGLCPECGRPIPSPAGCH